MSTPYEEIYDLFFGQTTDWELVSLAVPDQNDILEGWLLSTVGNFENCKEDLSDRDNTLKQFNQTLSDKVKRILAKGMVCEWLSPKLYTLDNLKNHLSSKDFNQYSPSAFLKEIRETHNKALKEFNKEKIKYGYSNFDPSTDLRARQ
jgi:hypothetical protein